LNNTQVLQQSIAGCAAVIHAAALIHIGWTRLDESRQVNVDGTRNVVAACLEHHARLVYVSTVDTLPAATSAESPIDEASTNGVPKTPCSYVISKCEAENVVRDAVVHQGLDAVIVHPGFMLAPFDWKPSSGRMMLQVNQTPFAFAPSGGCSLCDTRDVAHAIVNAIERGQTGQSYILAGENISYRDLWIRMMKIAGRSPRVRCFPHLLNFVAKVLNRFNPLLPFRENDINGAAIAMGQLYHYYNSAKAERELGYTRRPISETLADAWDWLKHRKSAR
jgi:dihydroflavonol-4-reductase